MVKSYDELPLDIKTKQKNLTIVKSYDELPLDIKASKPWSTWPKLAPGLAAQCRHKKERDVAT